MSATGRGSAREPFDCYETPAWCVRRYLESAPPLRPGDRVLEPSAGSGSIARVVRELYPGVHITAVELQSRYHDDLLEAADEVWCPQNFLRWQAAQVHWQATQEDYDLVIGNPPFTLADEFMLCAHRIGRRWAMLLRLNVLEGENRADLFRLIKPGALVLPNRPGFKRKMSQTDACAYAWINSDSTLRWAATTSLDERRRDHAELWRDRRLPPVVQEQLF